MGHGSRRTSKKIGTWVLTGCFAIAIAIKKGNYERSPKLLPVCLP
jgi:hypothetical protein